MSAETVAATTVPWYQLSILPFVMSVPRSALVPAHGHGTPPEGFFLCSRPLRLFGIA